MFFINVEGDSMKNAKIGDGDLLIVDRALTPESGSIVLAVLNNEFTVKRLHKSQDKLFLLPENKKYAPIEITEEMDFIVWGVVTYIIHRAK